MVTPFQCMLLYLLSRKKGNVVNHILALKISAYKKHTSHTSLAKASHTCIFNTLRKQDFLMSIGIHSHINEHYAIFTTYISCYIIVNSDYIYNYYTLFKCLAITCLENIAKKHFFLLLFRAIISPRSHFVAFFSVL